MSDELPDLLARLARRLAARPSRRWNLGDPGYEPVTVGMQAALPHSSVFAPAHNLASLKALERYLLH